MLALFVALGTVVSAAKTSLMASHRILVSLDAPINSMPISSKSNVFLVNLGLSSSLAGPSKGQIGSRDDLDKVHVAVSGVTRMLLCAVEGIEMVVSPWLVPTTKFLRNPLRQLWAEAHMVDSMRERVSALHIRRIPVIGQVMNVHVAIAVTASWGDMEIANDLVNPHPTFDAAAFLALRIQLFAIVFAFALLDVLAAAKGPGDGRVGVAYFVTSITTSCLLCVRWGGGAVALATV